MRRGPLVRVPGLHDIRAGRQEGQDAIHQPGGVSGLRVPVGIDPNYYLIILSLLVFLLFSYQIDPPGWRNDGEVFQARPATFHLPKDIRQEFQHGEEGVKTTFIKRPICVVRLCN